MFATPALAPIASVLISSILFIPINHLNILISVDPSKFCSAFLSAYMSHFHMSTFLYRLLYAYHDFSFICIYFGSLPLLCFLPFHHIRSIGVNISERKSETERTKKRELIFFPPPGGATCTSVHRLDGTQILPQLR